MIANTKCSFAKNAQEGITAGCSSALMYKLVTDIRTQIPGMWSIDTPFITVKWIGLEKNVGKDVSMRISIKLIGSMENRGLCISQEGRSATIS